MTKRPRLRRRLAVGTALTVAAALGGAGTAAAVETTPLSVASTDPDLPLAIPDASGATEPPTPGVAVSTLTVSGASGVIQDVDLTTRLAHSFSTDLEVLLTSPSGTTVPITTRNPRSSQPNDDVFLGTVWDDQANDPVTVRATFQDDVAATPLTPEAALAAFVGETPNGEWTLTVRDADPVATGTLESWSLDFDLAAPAPAATAEAPRAQETDVAIPDQPASGPAEPVTSQITVDPDGPAREIQDLDIQTGITHTATGDLVLRLTSPKGTTVLLSQNRGFARDDVFNGTVWDDSAGATPPPGTTLPVSDEDFTEERAVRLVPESAMAVFMGEDPRGTWTLEVTDNRELDEGTLDRWELRLSTVPTPAGEQPGTPSGQQPPPGQAAAAPPAPVCLPSSATPASDDRRPGRVRVSTAQLRINQRIYQAAVRRANAIQQWLDSGLVESDLCGGSFGARVLGDGITTGTLPEKQDLTAPAPRPIIEAQASNNPQARFRLSAAQLLINQRVAQAAVRRANGLQGRLDGGLTGGDLRDGALSQAKLAPGLAIASATLAASTPAPSVTAIASAAPRTGASRVRLSAAQLLINQRIGQAAIRRLNALRASLETGVPGTAFRPGSVTAIDLSPSLRSQ